MDRLIVMLSRRYPPALFVNSDNRHSRTAPTYKIQGLDRGCQCKQEKNSQAPRALNELGATLGYSVIFLTACCRSTPVDRSGLRIWEPFVLV